MKELEDQTRVRSILRLEHGNQAIRITEWHVRALEEMSMEGLFN